MSEKLFILCQDDLGNYEIWDDDKVFHFLWEVAPILNEQQATIKSKDKQLERLYNYFQDYLKVRTDLQWIGIVVSLCVSKKIVVIVN